MAFHRAERNLAPEMQMIVGDGLPIDACEIGRAEIVEAVVAVRRDQLGMVPGNRAVSDLDRVVRAPSDRNALAYEHMGDLAFVLREFDAEARHGAGEIGRVRLADVVP